MGRHKKVTVECIRCGKKREVRASNVRAGKAKFCLPCSRVKRSEKHTVPVECDLCGKPKRVRKSKYKEGRLFFCNNSHKASFYFKNGHPNRKDGSTYYRVRALRVHGAVCARCGYSRDVRLLDAHHKNGRKKHEDDDLEVLCVWCHAILTRKAEPHAWDGKLGSVVLTASIADS